jgi:hypothetical protein
VFFDKATTVTRIVGYYRVLEGALLGAADVGRWIGWENALNEFRDRQRRGLLRWRCTEDCLSARSGGREAVDRRELRCRYECVRRALTFSAGHRYWELTYCAFLGLSVLCVGLYCYVSRPLSAGSAALLSLAALLVLLSAFWNGRMVWQLIWGRHSYSANAKFWKQILSVREQDALQGAGR